MPRERHSAPIPSQGGIINCCHGPAPRFCPKLLDEIVQLAPHIAQEAEMPFCGYGLRSRRPERRRLYATGPNIVVATAAHMKPHPGGEVPCEYWLLDTPGAGLDEGRWIIQASARSNTRRPEFFYRRLSLHSDARIRSLNFSNCSLVRPGRHFRVAGGRWRAGRISLSDPRLGTAGTGVFSLTRASSVLNCQSALT